jgi:hypothetical protein
MGGRLAGRMRWEREGRTDSWKMTWVAPDSARMGEGVIAHKREGGERLSPELDDSNGKGVRMREAGDWCGKNYGRDKGKCGMWYEEGEKWCGEL